MPVVCHHGDAFFRFAQGHEDEIQAQRREVKEAGYDGVREWDAADNDFWRTRSGEDISTSPKHTPNYYDKLERNHRAVVAAGLRLQYSFGDLDKAAGLDTQAARLTHVRTVAGIHNRVGLPTLVAADVNEPQGTGARDPIETREMMDLYRQLTDGQVLTFQGAPYDYQGADGESKIALDAWSQGASGNQIHDYRGGEDNDKMRHPLQQPYEMDCRLWLFLRSEPPGPGEPVSVGKIEHPEAVALLTAIGAIARGLPTFFCGRPGIWSRHRDGRWARFADVPGFATAAKLVKRVHQFAPDLHKWTSRTHVGTSQGTKRVLVLPGNDQDRDVRIDQVIDRPGKRAVSVLYAGKPASVRVQSLVGGRTTVVHPLTLEESALTADRIAFDRGRILLTEW